MFFFFFFQAEDGIRDLTVTGVQTCALPIYPSRATQRTAARSNLARSCSAMSASTRSPSSRFSRGSSADRKSTRLNSSHSQISYAVFCLKKKKKKITTRAHKTTAKEDTAARV